MKNYSLPLILGGLAAIAAVSVACSPAKGTTGGTPTPTNTPGGITIESLHTAPPATGTAVSLTGLVVTAVDPNGDFWAQDPASTDGLNAGGFFYNKNHSTLPAVGDTVNVSGSWTPYSGPATNPWVGVYVQFEVDPGATGVTVTASGATPKAWPISNLAMVTCSSQNVCAAKPYEAQLLDLTGASPTINTVGLGYSDFAVSESVTGVDSVPVDTHDFPAMITAFEQSRVGDRVTTLRGVLANNFNAFKIQPTQASDIVFGGGTANTVANAQSFASINALLTAATGATPTVKPGQLVTVTGGVYVNGQAPYTNTKTSKHLTSFWAQDGLTGAANSGMYFDDSFYSIANSNNVAVTSHITGSITGKFVNFEKYYGATTPPAYAAPSWALIVGFADMQAVPAGTGTNTITPMTVTLAQVGYAASGATLAPYEGLLVKVADMGMKVVKPTNTYGEYGVGTTTTNYVIVGKQCFDTTAKGTLNNAITSVTGPFFVTHGFPEVEPRTAGDVLP